MLGGSHFVSFQQKFLVLWLLVRHSTSLQAPIQHFIVSIPDKVRPSCKLNHAILFMPQLIIILIVDTLIFLMIKWLVVWFIQGQKMLRNVYYCVPKLKITSSNLLFHQQHKNIQFTVKEEWRNKKERTLENTQTNISPYSLYWGLSWWRLKHPAVSQWTTAVGSSAGRSGTLEVWTGLFQRLSWQEPPPAAPGTSWEQKRCDLLLAAGITVRNYICTV